MDDRVLCERLEELLELQTLLGRDGRLSPALEQRRIALEQEVAPVAESLPVDPADLESAVRGATPWTALVPGAFRGLAAPLGRLGTVSILLLRLLGATAIGVGCALGVWFELSSEVYLRALLAGPLPAGAAAWGVVYPAAIAWSARRAHSGRARLPAPESTLLFGVTLLGLTPTVLNGYPPAVWAGAALALFGFALLSMALARPSGVALLVSNVREDALSKGRQALEAVEAAEARRWLELALVLSPHSAPEVVEPLSVAILIEAERRRLAGDPVGARALLRSRGLTPYSSVAEDAVGAWIDRSRAPRPELLEAAGLLLQAGRSYRDAGRPGEASRCLTLALSSPLGSELRFRVAAELQELGETLPETEIERLLGAATSGEPTSGGATRVLSELPLAFRDSRTFVVSLERHLDGKPPERAVTVLEALLGGSPPSESPRLHRLLAAAYRRLGHVGTARGIEAELGPDTPLLAPAPTPPHSTLGGGRQDTHDLAEALHERYRLVSRLGRGSMGEVHLAEDVLLGRQVALKVLRPQIASELFVQKFEAEARLVASLDHPGIVRAFDAGRVGPWAYFVMEFVDGADLATVMKEKTLPPAWRRVAWAVDVAEAMAYAHQRGVVHRDIKPANVLVDREGRARVTDFGIARAPTASPDATAFAQAGLHVGTPEYMAPEQLETAREAHPLTDVYALGVTLYFLIENRLPFADDPLEKLEQDAPPLTAGSAELVQTVAAALQRDPERRLDSMHRFAELLRAAPELAGGTQSSLRA